MPQKQHPHLLRITTCSVLFLLLLLIRVRAHSVFGERDSNKNFRASMSMSRGMVTRISHGERRDAGESGAAAPTAAVSEPAEPAEPAAAASTGIDNNDAWNPIWGLGPVIPPPGSLRDVEVIKDGIDSGANVQ